MKTMLSGIKPSGQLHLGSYLGAIKQFVKYQEDYEMLVFVANLHCITLPIERDELHQNLKDCIAFYLACGLDPKKSKLFLQSDVKEHAQLGWILSCYTYLGELNRMTQFKDKKNNTKMQLTGGFYTYPTLMAADILIYDADYVPVGNDQKQHVELARDVAIRFNNHYGDTFVVPKEVVTEVSARVMSLANPEKKMSKSEDDIKGTIYLKDTPKVIRKKVMSAVTDTLAVVKYDPVNQPGVSNLLSIYAALCDISIKEAEKEFDGYQYGDFKKKVADKLIEVLTPIQEKYYEVIESDILKEVLAEGAAAVSEKAKSKLHQVQKTIGLEIVD